MGGWMDGWRAEYLYTDILLLSHAPTLPHPSSNHLIELLRELLKEN
jgi:hypothetical protein